MERRRTLQILAQRTMVVTSEHAMISSRRSTGRDSRDGPLQLRLLVDIVGFVHVQEARSKKEI
jgi:hypothetical protein